MVGAWELNRPRAVNVPEDLPCHPALGQADAGLRRRHPAPERRVR